MATPHLPGFKNKKVQAGKRSIPILVSILTLGGKDNCLLIYTDCEPALKIFNNRWCKKNDALNEYIAYTDLISTKNYISIQVQAVPREKNYAAHHLSHGEIGNAQNYANLNRVVKAKLPVQLYKAGSNL